MSSRFMAWLNSPTGPRTTHFWGPVANWGFVIAVRNLLSTCCRSHSLHLSPGNCGLDKVARYHFREHVRMVNAMTDNRLTLVLPLSWQASGDVHLLWAVHEVCMESYPPQLPPPRMPCLQRDRPGYPTEQEDCESGSHCAQPSDIMW